jgi:hypothetical protein
MSAKPVEALYRPYILGDLKLKNRIVTAPLTRTRAENPGKVPNELMAEYYARSASDWGPHPMFGRMSPREWGKVFQIHVDYHLKQFGG